MLILNLKVYYFIYSEYSRSLKLNLSDCFSLYKKGKIFELFHLQFMIVISFKKENLFSINFSVKL